jgi:hypothetical protein
MNSRTEDPALSDRAWAGYDPRAGVPTLVIAGVLSLLVWTGRWYLTELSDRLGSLVIFAMAWCMWPLLLALYTYRAVTYTYRVTTRAVLLDFGSWHAPVDPVWLDQIVEVRSGGGWLNRLLGVGWVEVRTTSRAERLVGVRNPDAFAKQIRAAREAARGSGASPTPAPG